MKSEKKKSKIKEKTNRYMCYVFMTLLKSNEDYKK